VKCDRNASSKQGNIVRDNETDVSVNRVRDRNVIKKDAERILKYESFKNRNTRYVACKKVMPEIIGATGSTSRSFIKYLSNIPGKHEVKKLQKIPILGTARMLRKVLMWEMLLRVPSILTMEQLRIIYPGNMVCFRYIIINTLYKGD
jgi:hypothetical protein